MEIDLIKLTQKWKQEIKPIFEKVDKICKKIVKRS